MSLSLLRRVSHLLDITLTDLTPDLFPFYLEVSGLWSPVSGFFELGEACLDIRTTASGL